MKNKIKNVMIKLKTLFFLLLFSAVTFAQGNYTQRVIFLWDVTYSMHGGYFGTKGDQQVIIAGQTHTITKYLKKYDIYDAAEENTLARVSGGHPSIDGKACIVSYQVGAGRVILLGTFPDYHALKSIYTAALNDAGVENGKAEGELMVIPRKGDEISGLILVEYAGKPAAYTLDKPLKCAKTGATPKSI